MIFNPFLYKYNRNGMQYLATSSNEKSRYLKRFNSDVIEKCLAHEQKGVRAVYNKAEYAKHRRELLQSWADMIDKFVENFDGK